MVAPFSTYDLKKHGQGFSGFFTAFRSYSGAILPESPDAISIIESPQAVCHKLASHADNDNPANGIASGRQYYVFGPKYELKWLDKNL
jgi:hypothetical protein